MDDTSVPTSRLRLNWTIVFALNLVLPLPLGILVTQSGGTVGLLAGLFLCWGAGLAACRRMPDVVRAVTRGGFVVAALQGIMVVHVLLGVVAAWVWQRVTGYPTFTGQGWRDELDGFAMTILVAQPLLGAAWLFGGGPGLLVKRPAATAEEGDYLDPVPGEQGPGEIR